MSSDAVMEDEDDDLASPYERPASRARLALDRTVVDGITRKFEHKSWPQCRQAGSRIGLVVYAAAKKRRNLAIGNVQLALGVGRPEASRIARASLQNWGMTLCEFFHLPAAIPQEIRDYVELEGTEHLDAALARGKGAILLMAHFGNWELVGARLVQERRLAAIVRPLSNRAMQEYMLRVRRCQGIEMISKHRAGRPSLKLLKQGGMLCILPDRHAGPTGALLPLFGRPTLFESAPAHIALMSGAPIVPVFGVRRAPWLADGRIIGRIMPSYTIDNVSRTEREAAIDAGTARVIASIEEAVRANPEQWTWNLRRWRAGDATRAPQPVRVKTRQLSR